jgi:hypothetical protein
MQVPAFFPSVSMMDWETGRPNARYWALKMLRDNLGPGAKLVATAVATRPVVIYKDDLYAAGFVTPAGSRRILLVNKRNRSAEVSIPGARGGAAQVLDRPFDPPRTVRLESDRLRLEGLAVAIVAVP